MKNKKLTLADLPIPDFLEIDKEITPQIKKQKKQKHEDAFDAYCRWSALPKEFREEEGMPINKRAFGKLWKLPENYVYMWDDDEEFQARRLKYFWNWLFDRLPDVVYSSFQRAMAKTRGSSSDAKLLLELIGKKIEHRKEPSRIQPIMMVGVSQEQIESLFTPKEYIEVAEKTLELERKRHKIPEAELVVESV